MISSPSVRVWYLFYLLKDTIFSSLVLMVLYAASIKESLSEAKKEVGGKMKFSYL